MKFLDDQAVERLRAAADWPDLTGFRYRLLERIAAGGMGVIYKAEDTVLGRSVALKVLGTAIANGEMSQRLAREAQVLAQLEHPGIVPVHDAGTLPDGRMFYAMKYVVGDRLDTYAMRIPSLSDRLRLFLRICDAVAFAHARGFLHRDLNPNNIMVGPFGEVLVMDWGLAKVVETASHSSDRQSKGPESPIQTSPAASPAASNITHDGTIMGTPGYMPPEQARGETSRIDARSDIYSLGAVLRFLVTNPHAPAQEFTNRRALLATIAKAMAESPAHRYASVPELAADVSLYLDGLPVSSCRENLAERAARFYRRHQVAILLLAAYLLMRALFVLFPQPRP